MAPPATVGWDSDIFPPGHAFPPDMGCSCDTVAASRVVVVAGRDPGDGVVKLVKTSIRLADGRELLYFDEHQGVDRQVPDTRDLARPAPPARSAATRCWRSG
jgi:hypothetical protein